jgi:quinol monooxygenase YgiN
VILAVVTYVMDPADRERYVAARAARVAHSRKESGCLDYALSLDAFDESRVWLVERWATRDDFEAHVSAMKQGPQLQDGVEVTKRQSWLLEGDV